MQRAISESNEKRAGTQIMKKNKVKHNDEITTDLPCCKVKVKC